MMMLTFFVLFANDIATLTAPKSLGMSHSPSLLSIPLTPPYSDVGFETAYTICLFFFIAEFILSIIAKTTIKPVKNPPKYHPKFTFEGYTFSFFFWLDLIAILSLFPDISWIAEGTGIGNLAESVNSTNSSFSKAGRVVRTVRLARLVRIYKIQSERKRLARIEKEQMILVRQGLLSYEDVLKSRQLYQERNSKVGAELSDTITRRVIVMVLSMLCLVPVLNYTAPNNSQYYTTRLLHQYNVYENNITKELMLNDFMKFFRDLEGEPYVLYLEMEPYLTEPYIEKKHYLNILRSVEISKVEFKSTITNTATSLPINTADTATSLLTNITNTATTTSTSHFKTIVWYNNRYGIRETALNGILLTIFISFMMLTGTVVFTFDVENLVLKPIQRMMNLVEQVAKDPLAQGHFSHYSDDNGHQEESHEYETRLLEDTITKITSLLRVGFGEAGAGIISANLNIEDNTAVINPLIPGLRVYAIFGFCDIHHFDEVNEKLGKDIMTFVNTIANVVHTIVHHWRGQCNKNLGQAFLIVWRIGDEETLNEILHSNPLKPMIQAAPPPAAGGAGGGGGPPGGGKINSKIMKKKQQGIDLKRVPGVDVLADSALIGYLKIVAELNRSQAILQYRQEPRLTKNGTEEFLIRMGFGLHAGWAIEGAVGSLQKVDATYLSPHVNMAARLETSSKQYGVPLLMSQNFYELMSDDVNKYCRRLDVITVKGSEVPIGVYTYDLNQNQFFLSPKKPKISSSGATSGTPMIKPIVKSSSSDALFLTSSHDTTDVLRLDYDLKHLRHQFRNEFKILFEEGLEQYLQGDWMTAKGIFEKVNEMIAKIPSFEKGDGPSNTLLRYMEAHGWQAPASWKGYRPLTSK
jgi:class 3 adenylate cyclase